MIASAPTSADAARSAAPTGGPSRVTPKQLAQATATRQRRSAHAKMWIGAVCALVVVLPILFAGLLPLPGPDTQQLTARLLPPFTDGHLLGTDQLGRDLISRILH